MGGQIGTTGCVAMKRFVTSIKQKYRERRVNQEKQWPLCKSEKLVRLEMVECEQGQGYFANKKRGREDIATVRTPLAYADLFKTQSGRKQVRKILIEGDAGIGKTSLCTAISEDWANETLFKQFELVLLLPLRQKKVALANSASGLLELLHPHTDDCTVVANHWKKYQEKVLIIADGWDEVSENECKEDSFLYELLFGQCYSLVSVIVTSRPSASGSFHMLPCIDRFVEVHGFNEDDIKEYILSEFFNEHKVANGLLEQLRINPLVMSVCSVPLNCAIVCHLWRNLEGALPSTMTELYTKIILNVLKRNIPKKTEHKNISVLKQFDDIPKNLQHSWSILCELAFRGLEGDKIVFSDEDISAMFPQGLDALNEDIHCFGLLQTVESILIVGHAMSFHFLHLTFQEYLAALYLIRQPPPTQLELCRSQAKTKRFAMVWRFFFGISKFESSKNSLPVQEEIINSKIDSLTLCHCALEASDTDASYKIVSALQKTLSRGIYLGGLRPRSEHDCAAVMYVITNTQEGSGVLIDFRDCGLGEKQLTALADALANKEGKLAVKELDISGCNLTDKGVTDLFHRASNAFNSLEKLNFGRNKIGADSINSLSSMLKPAKSKSFQIGRRGFMLKMYDISLEHRAFKALEDLVSSCKLGMLNLAGSLSSDEGINASLILALNGNCRSLWDLDLSRNHLGATGASALGKILPQLPHSKASLFLNSCGLGDAGMSKLAESVEGRCHLKTLQLQDNNISAIGISCLADCICAGKIVIVQGFFNGLLLAGNPLRLEGVLVVARILASDHFQAKRVDLSRCKLTETGNVSVTCVSVGGHVFAQQNKAKSVQSLSLDDNNFSGDGVRILAGLMYFCCQLKVLECRNCAITSVELKVLLEQLSEFKAEFVNFDTWDLHNNKINDDSNGVSALIKEKLSVSLKTIDVGRDRQREEAAEGKRFN